ncbi:MAG: putative peroxidase-related enzyme [Reinekea sp.]|jgi:uncharacterized peroxidase-related enzyme|tara:strand:- start:710 stop:1255 length:546 start_codon:yes stop_codon:yes gene_type:complete
MIELTHYTPDTAPETTAPTLKNIEKMYGFIPNLYGYLAESPVALNAYLHINDQLMKHSSLSGAEVQLALLAISAENECEFCIAAHSMMLTKVGGNAESVAQVKAGHPVSATRDAALVNFVQALVKDRGHVADSVTQVLLDQGFSKENMYDLLVCNMLKSLSNYSNHLTHTEVNDELKAFAR